MRRSRSFLILLLLVVVGAASAAPALESDEQQDCLVAADDAFAAIQKAEARLTTACWKAAATGKLLEPTVEACIEADAGGKLAAASTKGAAAVANACPTSPGFGLSDLSGTTTVSNAQGRMTPLLRTLFGDDLASAVASRAVAPNDASCQAGVIKAATKCRAARTAVFRRCVRDGLAASIDSAEELGACRDVDADEKVRKACGDGVQKVFDSRCIGVDRDTVVAGCECRYPQECVRVAVANALNRALTDAVQLPVAAPVLPERRALQSLANGVWIAPAYGPFVASRIVGRDEDARLACPLAAMNIYTVQDAQADADYNAAILPLLLQQKVRVLFAPATPVDLASSPPGLVQGTQAMPLYRDAADFLKLSTRAESHDLVELKHAQVLDTLRFGFQTCLHDCAAIEAAVFPPFVFGSRLLVVHFSADRATIESAVAALAAEDEATPGICLRWAGRTVADFKLELTDGSVVQSFQALPADGTLLYELDAGVDPAGVLSLPSLSSFLEATTSDALLLLE
jgi:hypothetical protein